jgi:hypothetical protein
MAIGIKRLILKKIDELKISLIILTLVSNCPLYGRKNNKLCDKIRPLAVIYKKKIISILPTVLSARIHLPAFRQSREALAL